MARQKVIKQIVSVTDLFKTKDGSRDFFIMKTEEVFKDGEYIEPESFFVWNPSLRDGMSEHLESHDFFNASVSVEVSEEIEEPMPF